MIQAAENVLELVGNTPLVKCHTIAKHVKANIYLKLEYLNPGSSVKDRPALKIIADAEASGKLKPGGCIVEATSGNTGMGLAMGAAIKGYKCIFVMPDKMSDEKIKSLRAMGAKVVVCPTAVEPEDPRSYYSVAIRLAEETPGGFLANQYHNPSNPQAHYESTGPEIWKQFDGDLDVFVSSAGTGGTISGTGKYLKEQSDDITILAVDPIGSIYYDYFKTGKITEASTYKVEGFGEDFIPSTMNFDYIDEVIRVSDKECFDYTRRLAREEGVMVGGSSGGALCGAIKYAEREDREMNIVVIMCDPAGRYMSKIFDDDWMRENGFLDSAIGDGTVQDLLGKDPRQVITTDLSSTISEVVDKMKAEGISQLPVMEGTRVAGLISEANVLDHVLHGGEGSAQIRDLVETNFAIVEPTNRIALMGQFFKQNKVVIVIDANAALKGIITKIDFIDYLSRKI